MKLQQIFVLKALKKASKFGNVIVGLTSDNEILTRKGYYPELSFENRKEIIEAIKYVDEVVEVPWLLDDQVLDQYNIDFLVHGSDNVNQISGNKLKVFPRTEGVSSEDIRNDVLKSITDINNQKLMLTPGPAVVLFDNLKHLRHLKTRIFITKKHK